MSEQAKQADEQVFQYKSMTLNCTEDSVHIVSPNRVSVSGNIKYRILKDLSDFFEQKVKKPFQKLFNVNRLSNDNKPFNVEALSADYSSVNLTVGQKMADGSIYAGVSETTNTNMFAAPEDSGVMNWNNMVKYTENITDLCGRKGSKQSTEAKLREAMKNGTEDGGWRAPTSDELNQLYQNKKEIGGFKMEDPWYWSSSEYSNLIAYGQVFNDGSRYYYGKDFRSSVRCVRSVPRLAA